MSLLQFAEAICPEFSSVRIHFEKSLRYTWYFGWSTSDRIKLFWKKQFRIIPEFSVYNNFRIVGLEKPIHNTSLQYLQFGFINMRPKKFNCFKGDITTPSQTEQVMNTVRCSSSKSNWSISIRSLKTRTNQSENRWTLYLHYVAVQVCPQNSFSSWGSSWPFCAIIESKLWGNRLLRFSAIHKQRMSTNNTNHVMTPVPLDFKSLSIHRLVNQIYS